MVDRIELHRLIDALPEEKLELDDEVKKEVSDARERVKNGEYHTLDDLLKEYHLDVWGKD